MDISFSAAERAFRQEVRQWIHAALPAPLAQKAAVDGHFEVPEVMVWHRLLYEKGWVAPHWPKEHGGPGLDPARRFIVNDELELAGAPALSPFGLFMVGPLLMQYGTEEQQERFLPKILSGDEIWCQGYSEPNAGSDLASLRTTATDDGRGQFIVNGQKTWTTYAQYADWIFCLVRTDRAAKKQAGISFLLIDMKSEGVELKPMLTIGDTPSFCDTYFDNVKVPAHNLVGPLHGGWAVAKALLGHERTLIAAVGTSRRALRKIKRVAAQTLTEGKPLFDESYEYHERPTELEAYRYAVKEARKLGMSDDEIFEYLKVDWMEENQVRKLARTLGVNAPPLSRGERVR
jgi:alkylation response protein AidB-like acyl-CoA dehydrogenase